MSFLGKKKKKPTDNYSELYANAKDLNTKCCYILNCVSAKRSKSRTINKMQSLQEHNDTAH